MWIASESAFFFSNFDLDAATNYDGDVIKYTPATGTCEVLLAIVHSNGTVYFTDPDYQRGNRPQELPLAIYRIDPMGVISLIAAAQEGPSSSWATAPTSPGRGPSPRCR